MRTAFIILGTCILGVMWIAAVPAGAHATHDAPLVFMPVHYRHAIVSCAAETETGADHHESENDFSRAATPLLAWIIAQTHWTESGVPPVHFISRARLTEMYTGGRPSNLTAYSLYCDADHSIYLLDTWKADSLLDRSELLHELVHHLQYLNHVPATCPAEYEWQAYQLQAEWLHDQGVEEPLDLMGVSPVTIYLLSRCPEF